MKRHMLSVAGYLIATFGTQASSHFLVFANHYAQISFQRQDPIFAFGFLSMIIQGTILSLLHSKIQANSLMDSVRLAWAMGLFLVSYIGLAEAAKYAIPDIIGWITVEFLVGFAQFTLAGVFLNLAHGTSRSA